MASSSSPSNVPSSRSRPTIAAWSSPEPPRPRALLEARCDVHRVAGDDELVRSRADGSDHLAGVDADADGEGHPVLLGEAAVEVLEAREHFERSSQRPPGVIP